MATGWKAKGYWEGHMILGNVDNGNTNWMEIQVMIRNLIGWDLRLVCWETDWIFFWEEVVKLKPNVNNKWIAITSEARQKWGVSKNNLTVNRILSGVDPTLEPINAYLEEIPMEERNEFIGKSYM